MSDSSTPAWALLVPADASTLRRRASELRSVLGDGPDDDAADAADAVEVREGRLKHTAVLGWRPGSAGEDEVLARHLSREFDGETFALALEESDEVAGDAPLVQAYERGRLSRSLAGNPFTFAERLGCSLRPAAAAPPAAATVRSVCVVEGVRRAEVAAAFGGEAGLERVGLRVDDGPAGAIVQAASGDAGGWLWDLAEVFPQARVYWLLTGPDAGRFMAVVVRGEERLGKLELPPLPDTASFPPLTEVRGATAPADIATALGVPHHLLGWPAVPPATPAGGG